MSDLVDKLFNRDILLSKVEKCDNETSSLSPIQKYLKITFSNRLLSNQAKRALFAEYGGIDKANSQALAIIKILMRYEYYLVKHNFNRNKSNKFMESFEKKLAVFGFEANDVRRFDFIEMLRKIITYNATEL